MDIFAFVLFRDDFQDPWVIEVSYLSSMCGQSNPLIPCGISGTMCRREFPLDIQSSTVNRGARKHCASVSITWSHWRWLQPFHNLPGSLLHLGCNRPQILFFNECRTPEVVFKSPWVTFVRECRKDPASQLQCRAHFSHLILSWLAQGMLHKQSPV